MILKLKVLEHCEDYLENHKQYLEIVSDINPKTTVSKDTLDEFSSVLDEIKNDTSKVIGDIKNNVKSDIDTIKDDAHTVYNTVKEKTQDAVEQVVSKMKGIF